MGQCVTKPAVADNITNASVEIAAGKGKRRQKSKPLPSTPMDTDLACELRQGYVHGVRTRVHSMDGRINMARSQCVFPRRRPSEEGDLADDGVPRAPILLSAAIQDAIRDANMQWATSSAVVAAQLHEEVVYIDMRGGIAEGKQAALESMDAGVSRLLQRMSRSTRSGKTELRTDHIRLKVSPPQRMAAASKRNNTIWTVDFRFKLYLMNIHIIETYELDDSGKIVRLKRQLAGSKEVVVAKG
jgi:hypothetical protein